MTLTSDAERLDRYELVLMNSDGTEVLLQDLEGGYSLPTINIPRFTRPAERITSLLRNSWNTKTVLLWSGRLQPERDADCFAVLESLDDSENLPIGLRWFRLPEAITRVGASQAALIENGQSEALGLCFGVDPKPFSRLGWFDRIMRWTNGLIRPSGTEVFDFVQLNGCETFSLVKFETNAKPVWFKAVGEPNLREFSITLLLARLFPRYLPTVLATDPPLHGWLMADAGGVSLHQVLDPSVWGKAFTNLAHLQIDSIAKTNELLEAGCRDLRCPALFQLVDPFLDTMADLMMQQPKAPPSILTRQELSHLAATLKHALYCLGALRIPDTLGHRDFNPANIVVGPDRCTFIDWAEAHVGHPFLTAHYLIAHLRKHDPTLIPFEDDLRCCYLKPWLTVSSAEDVSQAFLLSPLVAVFAYAAGGSAWRSQEHLNLPRAPGYLRSLTRTMKREADVLQPRRVECLPS